MAEKGNTLAIVGGIAGTIIVGAGCYHMLKKIKNSGLKNSQDTRNSYQKQLAKKDMINAELCKINNGLTSLYKNEHEKVIALQNENLNLSLENRCLKSRLSLTNTAAFAKDYKNSGREAEENA